MIKNYIFLGAPGVGKGTLAKVLSNEKKMVHISTGDIFRTHIKNKTSIGQEVKQILSLGKYVPDNITNQILYSRIIQEDVLEHGFILDGYPRTLEQVKFLESKNIKIHKVILLNASNDIIQKRLEKRFKLENRKDDDPKVITNRISIYYKETAPLVDYYKKQDLIINIDASGDVSQNTKFLMKGLYPNDSY